MTARRWLIKLYFPVLDGVIVNRPNVLLCCRFLGSFHELQLASQVLHVLFLFLPLLWAFGLLPPLDALFLWGMEQALVFGLGGSPMSSNIRYLSWMV